MAKIIQSQQQVIVEPWWAKAKIIYIGLGMGIIWWVLSSIFRQYVVEPIACRDLVNAASCVNSFGIAGSIMTVLVAVVGTLLLVRYLQPRPVIVSVATAVILWNLASLADGLDWWFVLLIAIFFYAGSYGLFSLVARISWLWLSLAVAAIVVIITRLMVHSW
ncbi:MAG: hypothetical protein WAR37_00525 [Candidatus Microsaccharimonas sp.]